MKNRQHRRGFAEGDDVWSYLCPKLNRWKRPCWLAAACDEGEARHGGEPPCKVVEHSRRRYVRG